MTLSVINIRKQLNQPYPYSNSFAAAFRTILFISVFVLLFVLFFRSNDMPGATTYLKRVIHSSYFGLVTLLGASFNTIILDMLIHEKEKQNWKVKHEILVYMLHFLTISISIYVMNVFIRDYSLDFLDFISSVLITILVGSIPVTIHIIQEEKKLLKQHLAVAKNIDYPKKNVRQEIDETCVQINGQDLSIDSIVYIESDRNYLNIFSTELGDIKFRGTLKEFSILVKNCTYIVRCHRAFMVNIQWIENVTGNAQGLSLYLSEKEKVIPVSRKYIPVLKSMI